MILTADYTQSRITKGQEQKRRQKNGGRKIVNSKNKSKSRGIEDRNITHRIKTKGTKIIKRTASNDEITGWPGWRDLVQWQGHDQND
jgi:hypothetical protein